MQLEGWAVEVVLVARNVRIYKVFGRPKGNTDATKNITTTPDVIGTEFSSQWRVSNLE